MSNFIPLSDEALKQTVEAYEANGRSKCKTAKILDLSEKAVRNRLKIAARKGLMDYDPVLPGFEVAEVTTRHGKDGETIGKSIRQRQAKGEGKFKLPKGMNLKHMSTLVDADGRTMLQWLKASENRDPVEEAKVIRDAFDGWEPKLPMLREPSQVDSDRLVVYIAADWHLGLFAWAKETEGEDWDLTIARRVIYESMRELIEQSPPAENAIFLGLGDLIHADSSKNMTERSGNVLDVDTRYPKVLATACDLIGDVIELIAAKHKNVFAAFKPGNHDENSTTGIRCALRMLFREHSRIHVCDSPSPFFWHRFGVNLIGGTHGDKAKMPELPLIMANRRAKDWAETFSRHIFTGHIHHDRVKEIGGVRVHSVRAPVAQDAYHGAHGYLSGRSVKSVVYHRERGYRGSSEVELTSVHSMTETSASESIFEDASNSDQ